MPDPSTTGWIDGRLAPLREATLTIDDPAFHGGVGLYETLAVRDGRPLELDEHIERLRGAADELHVPLPDAKALRDAFLAVAELQDAPRAWLKLIATRGGRCVVFGGTADPDEEDRPVSAVLLPWRRNPHDPQAGTKSLNQGANALGMEEARRRGADEGVWLNTRGHLTEGCSSNLFIVCGRKLFTAAVRDGVLPGVIRDMTLQAARDLGLVVHEGKVRLKRLETADEAFLTSSVRGVRPLVTWEGRPVGRGRPGPVTREIATAVAAMRRPA